MDPARTFARLAATLARLRLETAPAAGADATRAAGTFIDEIVASTALAGSPCSRAEVEALVSRGVALGEHRLEAYVMVADYAAAARSVRDALAVSRRRPYLRADEIVALHALATRRSERDRPGLWRSTTLPVFPSGMVAPPAWLVPREMAAYVERLAGGPDQETPPVLWVAAAHARFERVAPFATANGRVGRLVANLLLRRLGYPPLVITAREAGRYLPALRRADARDPWPLAFLFAGCLRATLLRLAATARGGDELVVLARLAGPHERTALYKAAERGRLHAVRRGGALLSTQAWVDEYRASRRAIRRAGHDSEARAAASRKGGDGDHPRDARDP